MEQKQGKDRIQILTTLDQNYLPRLQVLLTSLYLNQPDEKTDIWLLHSRIPEEALIPVTDRRSQLPGCACQQTVSERNVLPSSRRAVSPQEPAPHHLSGSRYPCHQPAPPAVGYGYERESLRSRIPYRYDRTGKQYQPAPPWNKP